MVLGLGWLFMKKSPTTPIVGTATGTVSTSELTVTIISDKRCTYCPPVDQIITKVKQIPFLTEAKYVGKDFADAGVAEYLKTNKIGLLPAFILSDKNVWDAEFQAMLAPIENNEYVIKPELSGGTYNPFAERSKRGFLVVNKDMLATIKWDSFVQWNADADITWLEFSDLQCPFCARLHKSWVVEALDTKYGTKINKIFNHYPLPFHDNAPAAAAIVECAAKAKGKDAFYELIHKSFEAAKMLDDGNVDTLISSSKKFLVDEAVKMWVDKKVLEECISSEDIKKKVEMQAARWAKEFGVTGTPANILINNKTLEYEVVTGAQPKEAFIDAIDKLLKE